MLRSAYLKFQVSATERINQILYILCHLPVISTRISESVFARTDIKRKLGILALVVLLLQWFCGKLAYFLAFICFPMWFLHSTYDVPYLPQLLWSFFMLNGIFGARVNAKITDVDEQDYLYVLQLHMNPRAHYFSKVFVHHMGQILFYVIALYVTLVSVFHASPGLWIRVLCVYIPIRFVGEAWNLWYSDRFGLTLAERPKWVVRISCGINVVCVVTAYGLLLFLQLLPVLVKKFGLPSGLASLPSASPGQFFIAWPVMVLLLACGVVSVWYLWKYDRYTYVANHLISRSALDAQAEEVEQAVNPDKKKLINEESEEILQQHRFEDKEGYAYLNALFFARHKTLVRRPVRIKAAVAGALLFLGAIAIFVLRATMSATEVEAQWEKVWTGIQNVLPCMVFAMYWNSSGKNTTQALFYNCDNSLLKYGYYRKGEAILQNFRIRLRYMILAELPFTLVLSVGIFADLFLLGKGEHLVQILAISVCIVVLTIFFMVWYLCMYYIFQPYTEAGKEVGMGYRFCDMMVYIVVYGCLQIHTAPTYFATVLLVAMVVLLGAAYVVAWKLAPKRFVLK